MWWLIVMVNMARHRHTNETYLWACPWSRARGKRKRRQGKGPEDIVAGKDWGKHENRCRRNRREFMKTWRCPGWGPGTQSKRYGGLDVRRVSRGSVKLVHGTNEGLDIREKHASSKGRESTSSEHSTQKRRCGESGSDWMRGQGPQMRGTEKQWPQRKIGV